MLAQKIAEFRKFLLTVIAGLATVVNLSLANGDIRNWIQVAIAVLTAAAVALTPNADPPPSNGSQGGSGS